MHNKKGELKRSGLENKELHKPVWQNVSNSVQAARGLKALVENKHFVVFYKPQQPVDEFAAGSEEEAGLGSSHKVSMKESTESRVGWVMWDEPFLERLTQ